MSQAENYIPWEQIEPLLKPGMTAYEMTVAVLTRFGLDPDLYTLTGSALPGESLRDSLRRGAYVERDPDPADKQRCMEIIY